jgi:hypothetical protein
MNAQGCIIRERGAVPLNHPLISTKLSNFKGLQLPLTAQTPSSYGHLRK